MKIIRLILLAVFVVAGLLYLNSIIPNPQQTQAITYQEQNHFLAQEFPAKNPFIKIGDTESPDCSNGSISNLSGYTGGANFMLENTSSTYKIDVVWGSYFCAQPDGSSGCNSNQQLTPQEIFLSPGDYIYTGTAPRTDANTCGAMQTDMAFVAYKNVCNNSKTETNPNCWQQVYSSGDMTDPGASNATWTSCSASAGYCTPPTPTPTTPVTPTPTVPVTPTPTTPVTPTPTTPVTPTPTTPVTPTPTVPVTPTPTTPVTPTPTTTGCDNTTNANCQSQNQTQTVNNNITNNNNITVEQQQQQAVLAASVAPASSSTTQLPSTGAGTDILFGLMGLLPIGFKLRKLI